MRIENWLHYMGRRKYNKAQHRRAASSTPVHPRVYFRLKEEAEKVANKARDEVKGCQKTILIVILALILLGSLPTWPCSTGLECGNIVARSISRTELLPDQSNPLPHSTIYRENSFPSPAYWEYYINVILYRYTTQIVNGE